MLASGKLFGLSRSLLVRAGNGASFKQSRASYIRGYWPEPITQQTLDQFLHDINYFDEPKQAVNIGLQVSRPNAEPPSRDTSAQEGSSSQQQQPVNVDVDKVFDLLGEEAELPSFDLDDALVSRHQLMELAISSGIFRDLFGNYKPNREHIRFTPEQAERLYKLVPHHWITDQPFARVDRKPKEPDPLKYFEPVVRISAKFVNGSRESATEEHYAHPSYHGNIIPAHGAQLKPSITLDGCWLESDHPGASHTRDSQFNNWEPGRVCFENLPASVTETKYHSVLLMNLDSIHPNSANLHWMVANISRDGPKGEAIYEEVCDYLPVFGIRGFGYSRYVFLALQHDSKLDTSCLKMNDFSPQTRRFDVSTFLELHSSIKMVPVGLSWFQTVWDESSNGVFHDFMKMRAPVYEHVQEKLEKRELLNKAYPGKIPFHIFMDHYRDPKEIEEHVLLERLKTVDPFNYKDQYEKPRVPPTVFEDPAGTPSWMRTVLFKKKNKLGVYRGLRPASATLPLNNNADLDKPIRPITSSRKALPGYHNLYIAKPRKKLLKDLPYSKPASEHTNVYVYDGSEIHQDEVKKSLADKPEEATKK